MSRFEKLIDRLKDRNQDQGWTIDELSSLLTRLGWAERSTGGSHRIFTHGAFFVNLQKTGGNKAKPYQVRQTREMLAAAGII